MRNFQVDADHRDDEKQKDHVRVEQEGVEVIKEPWLYRLHAETSSM